MVGRRLDSTATLLCAWVILTYGILVAFPAAGAFELANGDIVVTIVNNTEKFIRIDPVTHDASEISLDLDSPSGVVVSPYGNLYVADGVSSTGGIHRIDPRTEEREPIYQDFPLQIANDLAFDSSGNLIVVNGAAKAVLRFDLTGGGVEVVSAGENFLFLAGVAVGPNGDLFVVDSSARVFRVDPVTGAQTIVGSGGDLDIPRRIAIDASGDLLVTDSGSDKVLRIDPNAYDPSNPTANQSVVSDDPKLKKPAGIAVEASGGILIADTDAEKVFRINPSTGVAQTIWNASGSDNIVGLTVATLPACPGDPVCGEEEPLPDATIGASDDVNPGHSDIAAKAQALGSPLAIYQYVHDEIEYEVYYGSKKGALGTLWSGSGNDYDQASLLIALLRVLGVPARYSIGVVDVDADQLKQWAGVADAGDAMGRFEVQYCLYSPTLNFGTSPMGICAAPPPTRFERRANSITMEHAWVEAQLPSHYRGLDLADSGDIWVPLDPSWKQKAYRQRINLPIGNETLPSGCAAGELCFDYGDYYSDVDPRLGSEIWESQIQAWIADPANEIEFGKTVDDVIYDGPIVPYEGEVLPTSLPFIPVTSPPVVAVGDIADVGDGIDRHFRIDIRSCLGGNCGNSSNVFDYGEYTISQLVGSRITYDFRAYRDYNSSGFPLEAASMEYGGFLGGTYKNHENLATYCKRLSKYVRLSGGRSA